MKRYAKENYVHDWTAAQRSGHLYAVLFEELAEFIRGPALMLGCNSGSTLAYLQRRIAVTGIDINEEAVARARGRGRRHVEVGNALDMRFDDRTFQTILALDFIEHVYPFDMPRLVQECARVLEPGGHLIAFSPRTDPENPSESAMDPAHVQWFVSASHFSLGWRGMFDAAQGWTGGEFELVKLEHEKRANPGDDNPHDAWLMVLRRL